jgi:Tfp pilus assembly major pilin PilA
MYTADLWSKFSFDVPIELVKAEEDENGWKIRGLASTSDKDLQGEVVKQNGLDISPIKRGSGWINYNHSNAPEDIVGKLDDAEISGKGLMVEGYLFKKHKRAQSIYQILKSLEDKDRQSVKLSIEGKILKRAGTDNKTIASAKVDKVAITLDPINCNTYVELVKAMTDKTIEWTPDNIMSEGDEKHENDPANSAGDAVTESRDNDGMSPSEPNIKNTKDVEPDVHTLLKEIAGQLRVLTDALVHQPQKEAAIKSFTEEIKSGLIEKLSAKLNIG